MMNDLLRNLLLAASCLPLVIGCCWQECGSTPNAFAAAGHLIRAAGSADAVTEEKYLQTPSCHQDSDPADCQHVCLRGVLLAASSHAKCAAEGVQICYSDAEGYRSHATRRNARLVRNVPLSNALRLHLAKRVLLI
jgi:hypothetical protein